MKKILTPNQCRAVLFSVASLTACAAMAEDAAESKWQVRFGPSIMFNASARFQGHPANPTLAGAGNMPGAANYDNGYVGLDISGDPNFSTYWGYNDASQQVIAGGNVTGLNYERTTPGTDATSPKKDAGPSVGGEVILRRQLTKFGETRFGLELGGSFNGVRLKDSSSYSGSATRTTYGYNLPAPVNSALFPPPGYQGPFNGAGPIINPTVATGATTTVPNAVFVTGEREVNASIFGLQFGPYIEIPITKRFSASVSAGALLAIVNDRVNWSENIFVNTAALPGYYSGSSSATSTSWGVSAGFYAGADINYEFRKNWSAFAGAKFQDAGTYSHDVGQGKMNLDLGKTISCHLGVGYSF